MTRWLCECERTNAAGTTSCWFCEAPRAVSVEDTLRTRLAAAEADLAAARALLREAHAWVHEVARNFGPTAAKSLDARIAALLGGGGT